MANYTAQHDSKFWKGKGYIDELTHTLRQFAVGRQLLSTIFNQGEGSRPFDFCSLPGQLQNNVLDIFKQDYFCFGYNFPAQCPVGMERLFSQTGMQRSELQTAQVKVASTCQQGLPTLYLSLLDEPELQTWVYLLNVLEKNGILLEEIGTHAPKILQFIQKTLGSALELPSLQTLINSSERVSGTFMEGSELFQVHPQSRLRAANILVQGLPLVPIYCVEKANGKPLTNFTRAIPGLHCTTL